jgi:hypothetical protein
MLLAMHQNNCNYLDKHPSVLREFDNKNPSVRNS